MRKINKDVIELWEYDNKGYYINLKDPTSKLRADYLYTKLDNEQDVIRTETDFFNLYELPSGGAIITSLDELVLIRDYATTNKEIGNYLMVQITADALYKGGYINETSRSIFRDL